MSIKSIVTLVQATSGKNDTITLLNKHKTNTTLKEFFRLALDTRIKFHVKQIPVYTKVACGMPLTLDGAMSELTVLSERQKTGNNARDFLASLLDRLEPDDAEMLELIIKKKINCGMTKKTANKVWGNSFIRDKSYMRCDLSNPKTCAGIKLPAILEKKMDGQYGDHFCDVENEMYLTESRSGVAYDFMGELDEAFLDLAAIVEDQNPGIVFPVFNGELLCQDASGKIISRQISNGIVTKAGEGKDTISLAEAKSVIAVLWDVIPKVNHDLGEWKIARIKRMTILENAIKELNNSKIRMVDYIVVNTLAEAFEQNSKWQQAGEEGSILKDTRGVWKSGTSKHQLKLKVKFAADYFVTGIEEGTGKFAGSMGAILFESSDGKIKGKVGSGWKSASKLPEHLDYDRQYIWDNFETKFKGMILTICANDITKGSGSDTWALSHPSIDLSEGGWRDPSEKCIADTYEKCLAELNSAKFVKTAQA